MSDNTVTLDFHFRTKDGYKRPSVSVSMEALTVEQVANYLNDEKVGALIIDTLTGVISSHVRGYVESDLDFDQAKFDELVAKGETTLEFIASIPKADRNVLSKEDLESFAKDYIQYMPEITGKEVSRVQAAAALFVERFKRAAGDNNVLEILQEQLSIFVDNAPAEVLENHQRVITWAMSKLEELLSIKITADAL